MVKSKKGLLRILEAVIAIMLIAGVAFYLYVQNFSNPQRIDEIYSLQKSILNEIGNSPQLRESVLKNSLDEAKAFVGQRVPVDFNYTVKICEISDICGLTEYQAQVYSSERVISSTLKEYSPKKIKIFIWSE